MFAIFVTKVNVNSYKIWHPCKPVVAAADYVSITIPLQNSS